MSEKIYSFEKTAIINRLLASKDLDKDIGVFVTEVEDKFAKTRIRFEEIMEEKEQKLKEVRAVR